MEWDGLFIATHRDVYEPHDDTWLLAKVVKQRVGPGDRFLEVGCGTGVVAMCAARNGATVSAVDINPHAVELLRHNAKQNRLRIDVREADLLAGAGGPFDVIAFNPPYLPTAEDEKVQGVLNHAFDGGPDGNQVVLRFAAQLEALPAADRPREVLVVHSSLSDPTALESAMGKLGYQEEIVAREKHFMEELWVRRFY